MNRYFLHLLISIDQVATTLIGGWPDETLSSYAHRKYVQGKPGGFMRNVINRLFFWQKDHCLAAYLEEVKRLQFPRALR